MWCPFHSWSLITFTNPFPEFKIFDTDSGFILSHLSTGMDVVDLCHKVITVYTVFDIFSNLSPPNQIGYSDDALVRALHGKSSNCGLESDSHLWGMFIEEVAPRPYVPGMTIPKAE